jgi:hypothetical protein
MKKTVFVILSAILVLSMFLAGSATSVSAREPKILEFDTMVGVPSGLTGTQSPIRGINGGGVPWVLTSAHGELKTSGKLEIEVQGLVLATTLSNPSANFRAIVSCLNSDGSVAAPVVTGQFSATTGLASAGGGNAKIDATVTLPHPCIAPIIFVTNGGGTAWFAVTGN